MDEIEEPNPQLQPKSWPDQFKRLLVLTRLAHDGVMISKLQRQNRIVEDLAKRSANGTIGQKSEAGDEMPEDDTVSIGNEYHYHYQGGEPTAQAQPTPPAQPAQAPATPAAPATPSDAMSTLSKGLLAAALVGSGMGGLAVGSLLSQPGTPPAASTDTDTDTRTDVTFPK